MLRRHVHWKVSDLAKSIEEGLWDIILWRNMAIYLNAESAESVWGAWLAPWHPKVC
jgi:chemotaxis methyl-accepting protein methylase